MVHAQQTLADLAAAGPEVRSILLRHRLDFCCGGRRSLATACEEAGLPTDTVVTEIEAALTTRTDALDPQELSAPELVEHVLERYHRPLPQQLEAVIAAAEKVERVHRDKPTCPHGLAAHLRTFRDGLLSHLAKEEGVLFPAILRGQRGNFLGGPVRVMMHEHDEHGAALRKTRALAHDLVPPAEACRTWRALYDELTRVETELMEHVHLENHILFPRALGRG